MVMKAAQVMMSLISRPSNMNLDSCAKRGSKERALLWAFVNSFTQSSLGPETHLKGAAKQSPPGPVVGWGKLSLDLPTSCLFQGQCSLLSTSLPHPAQAEPVLNASGLDIHRDSSAYLRRLGWPARSTPFCWSPLGKSQSGLSLWVVWPTCDHTTFSCP